MRTEKWESIGQRIAQIRGKRSIREFAQLTGVHKNTLGNYERGETSINGDFVQALVEMGYSANWVLAGIGPMLLKEMEAQRFDVETLEQAVKVLETRLKATNSTMGADDKAKMTASIYQLLIDQGGDEKSRASLILQLLSLDH